MRHIVCIGLLLATAPALAGPFDAPSTLPYQAPPFDRIKDADYRPALESGMAEASIAYCDAGEVTHFPEATHWLAAEEPARVNALLLEFLRR